MENQNPALDDSINIRIIDIYFFPYEENKRKTGVCRIQVDPMGIQIGNIFFKISPQNKTIRLVPPVNNYVISENEKVSSPTIRFDDKNIWRSIKKLTIHEIKSFIKDDIAKFPIIHKK